VFNGIVFAPTINALVLSSVPVNVSGLYSLPNVVLPVTQYPLLAI